MVRRVRWARVLAAALLAEVVVVVLVLAAATLYIRLFEPTPLTDAGYQALGQRVGAYVAPAAGAIGVFLMAWWIGRRLESDHLLNGVMVGAVSAVLTLGFFLAARPEDRLIYGVALALRVATGYLGGLAARRTAAPRLTAGAA